MYPGYITIKSDNNRKESKGTFYCCQHSISIHEQYFNLVFYIFLENIGCIDFPQFLTETFFNFSH